VVDGREGVSTVDTNIKVDREDFEALCEEYNVTAYLEYSGRGMFDKTCVGAYGSVDDLAALAMALDTLTDGDYAPWRSVSQDSLGRNTIWYWRKVKAA
jgi:hypothetical protein